MSENWMLSELFHSNPVAANSLHVISSLGAWQTCIQKMLNLSDFIVISSRASEPYAIEKK
jgi:hypothetical protein